MFIKTATPVINKRLAKKPHLLAMALISTSLMTGLSTISMSAQAAGLGELFGNNNHCVCVLFFFVLCVFAHTHWLLGGVLRALRGSRGF